MLFLVKYRDVQTLATDGKLNLVRQWASTINKECYHLALKPSRTVLFKVPMKRNFYCLKERAFKMMENGVYFIVIILLVAELCKILIYANTMTRDVTLWTLMENNKVWNICAST